MEFEGTKELIQIFNNLDVYMLIFVRIIGFLTLMPIIGGTSIPRPLRLGLAMAIASIVYTSGVVTDTSSINHSLIGYGVVILKEFFVGLIIGFVVFLIFNTIYFTGFLTDQQMGYSMANVFDPLSNTQVPITGNLYYFFICVLFVLNRGSHMVISTLFYSFKALPIGKAYIVGNSNLVFSLTGYVLEFFKIGTLIALPIIGIILVMDIVLGILVRTVPKMNVFAVGMPLKVIAGLLGIWLIVPIFSEVYIRLYNLIFKFLINSIKVMIP